MYTNIASITAKLPSLQLYVQLKKPVCVFISETWLSSSIDDAVLGLNSYLIYRNDRSSKGGGVCIFLDKKYFCNFRITRLNVGLPHIESIFLQISNSNLSFTLGCIYRPPNTVITDDVILTQEFQSLSANCSNLMIAGDFNFPQLTWPIKQQSENTSSNSLFADLIMNSNLHQLPPSLPHTIHRSYVHDSLETVILNENLLLEEMYRINVNSAPGPDNITAKTLKFCADALVQPLLHIFKLSFQSSSLPSGWLKALVTPIYKKGEKTLACNYRPISLTSICCKLMERIISKQLTEFALNHSVIPKEQHGFLPGRSVFTCHLHCLNKWTSDLDNSRPVDVV
jgi:hypothetical protein